MEKEGRIISWFEGKPQPPFSLEINPTNICNLNCKTCVARGKAKIEKELDQDIWLRIIDECAEIGVKRVTISGGGEPFSRPDLTLSIMSRIKKHGMYGKICTNGTLIVEDNANTIAAIGWDEVSISIDGPDAEVNDSIRGNGTFKKSTQTIRWLVSKRKKPMKISIATVLCSMNHDSIPNLLNLADELGADELLLQPVNVKAGNPNSDRLVLSSEMVDRVLKDIKRPKKEGVDTNFSQIDRSLLEKSSKLDEIVCKEAKDDEFKVPCFYPWYYIGIKAAGYYGPCGVVSIGQIKDKKIKDIWYDEFEDFRKKIIAGNLPNCRDCCGASVISVRYLKKSIKDSKTHVL